MTKKRVLVSACLVGWNCRYNGGSRISRELLDRAGKEGWLLVPVCPEVLGGLGIPREPAAIVAGDGQAVIRGNARVINKKGRDVTKAYVSGAKKTLEIARKTLCFKAILKENSPSCGVTCIKDREGIRRKGKGVTAMLLRSNNIPIENCE